MSVEAHPRRSWHRGSFTSRLGKPAVDALFVVGHQITYPPGARLSTQGEATPPVRVVLDGVVKVFRLAQPEGSPVLVNVAGPGDLLSVEAALLRRQSHTSHVAGIRTDCLVINQTKFRNFAERHPGVHKALTETMAAQVALREAALAFANYSVRGRVIAFLSRMQAVFGRPSPWGIELDVGLSHIDLASAVGASVHAVAKVLAELRNEGVLITGYRRMYVKVDLRELISKES
ncbi:Crp/Fnr family transcriptional regulator [Actinosynnema sp. CS-041913]|uniref:Crp/Fnr family transcriptional regulator n=1 Tax=Actinosynnema sp. CS-041913 TaxID=3239917 RepID=UPI003D934C3B